MCSKFSSTNWRNQKESRAFHWRRIPPGGKRGGRGFDRGVDDIGAHIGISEIMSPVEGLKTGDVSRPNLSFHSPPMKSGQGSNVFVTIYLRMRRKRGRVTCG